jgi:hypothetical protein
MPRFVILEHDHPEPHWDFMLEVGMVLKTWRLARPPEATGEKVPALALGDHRVFYLDYEGPVSGNRGTVKRWDVGTYEIGAAQAGEEMRVLLDGKRVRGVAALASDSGGWSFTWLES